MDNEIKEMLFRMICETVSSESCNIPCIESSLGNIISLKVYSMSLLGSEVEFKKKCYRNVIVQYK